MVLSKHYCGSTDTEADPWWQKQLEMKRRYETLNPGHTLTWNSARRGWQQQGKTIAKYSRKGKTSDHYVHIKAEDVGAGFERLTMRK